MSSWFPVTVRRINHGSLPAPSIMVFDDYIFSCIKNLGTHIPIAVYCRLLDKYFTTSLACPTHLTGLAIGRFCFCSKEDTIETLLSNRVNLFLSTDTTEVLRALQRGVWLCYLSLMKCITLVVVSNKVCLPEYCIWVNVLSIMYFWESRCDSPSERERDWSQQSVWQ